MAITDRPKSEFPAGREELRAREAADCLRASSAAVICAWEERVRREGVRWPEHAGSAMRRQLPEFLAHLADYLESTTREPPPPEVRSLALPPRPPAGREVGARAATPALAAVLLEYAALRDALLEVLEPRVPLEPAQRAVILRTVDAGMRDAAERFLSLWQERELAARHEAQRNAERLELAAASGRTAFWEWQLPGGEPWYSENFAALFGLPRIPPDWRFEAFLEIIHPCDRARVAEAWRSGLREREHYYFEFRAVWPDGTDHWIASRGHIQRHPVSRLATRVVGALVDVQDQKKVEESLIARESEVRAIFEQAGAGVSQVGLDGKFIDVNARLCEILGYSRERLLGLDFRAITHPDDREAWSGRVAALFEGSERELLAEKRNVRADGSIVWLSLAISLVRDERNRPRCLFAIVQDITQRKEAELRLRESEKRFRDVTEAVPQLLWAARADGQKYYYNRKWYDYTGLPEGDSLPDSWHAVVHPDDLPRVLAAWDESLREGRPLGIEERIRGRDGQYRWFLVRATPSYDSEGRVTGWFGTSTDIDEQRKLLASLQEERDLRERFIATLTHDLRSPLTAAKSSAELIQLQPHREDIHLRLARKIISDMDRLDRMIRDLLDASRLRAGEGIPLGLSSCDLREIADTVVDAMIAQHGPRFRLQARGEFVGFWSPDKLRRVLENLVTNAVKYGDSSREVTISLSDRGDWVRLGVHNWGNPIPDDDQRRLFQPYQRVATAQGSGKLGWGLGLTLARGITEAHGGRLSVRSNPNDGTTFTVELPRDMRNHADDRSDAAA